jgi:Flp pilus assembly protein TadD
MGCHATPHRYNPPLFRLTKGFMTLAFLHRSRLARLALALLLALAGAGALADDYSEVSQLLRLGQSAQALSRAELYLQTRPRDPQMQFLKGVSQSSLGQVTEAIASFTRLTQDYPELPEPYNNLAVLYAGQNQFDKARAALETATRTNPNYATAHQNLSDIYLKLASQALDKALALEPGDAAAVQKRDRINALIGPAAP